MLPPAARSGGAGDQAGGPAIIYIRPGPSPADLGCRCPCFIRNDTESPRLSGLASSPLAPFAGNRLLRLAQAPLDPPDQLDNLLGLSDAPQIDGVELVSVDLFLQFLCQFHNCGHVLARSLDILLQDHQDAGPAVRHPRVETASQWFAGCSRPGPPLRPRGSEGQQQYKSGQAAFFHVRVP